VNSFPRIKKRSFQSFTVKGNFQPYEVLKNPGLRIRSLLVNFVVFTANLLARTQPVHYQEVDPTTGAIFIQRFVSMKIHRIIWKPHGVSVGYQRFCSGKTIDKEHEKNRHGSNDVSVGASELAEAVKSPL